MSSFKVVTTIQTEDSFGEKEEQSWVSLCESLVDTIWNEVEVSKGAINYVWSPADWEDFRPTDFSRLMMVSDNNLDVELGINSSDVNVNIRTNRIISEDTTYHVQVSVFSGVTLTINDGVTLTIDDVNESEFSSFRLAKNTPFVLGADDVYYDHKSTTDAAFGGTLGLIDSIRVSEPSTAAVNLTMVMGN